MELSYLRIDDFRNLQTAAFEPGPRFNVFCGHNGQGKTNLLEAVYLLSAVKSFRGQRNSQLIRWGAPAACVEGRIERAGSERIARIEITPQGKNVSLNGAAVKKLSRFFGSLNAIVFAPDDLSLIKEGPEERRKFIDRAIFNVSASYLADVMAYQSVLKQRNALLKGDKPAGMFLDVYDEQLANLGAAIVRRRLDYLKVFTPIFVDTFRAIFSGESGDSDIEGLPPLVLEASLRYKAAWGTPIKDGEPLEETALAEALMTALGNSRQEDRRRRFTTRGPHRDDINIQLSDHPAKGFASQGQQRALVLALKIAEVRLFQDMRGFRPLLLLDDVSSELDRTRNRFLFDFLASAEGQVFITTTHRDHILIEDQITAFDVQRGTIAPQKP